MIRCLHPCISCAVYFAIYGRFRALLLLITSPEAMSKHSDSKRDGEAPVELESQFIMRLPPVSEVMFVFSNNLDFPRQELHSPRRHLRISLRLKIGII